MRAVRAFLFRLMNLLDKGRKDRELAEEFESHLRMQIDDNVRAGMSPEQARREALLKSGGLETSKESCRDRRGLPLVETVLRDFAYAMRQVRRSPGFAAAVVLTLALGIGANTAIFTLVHQLILELLPVKHPEELVLLTSRGQHYGSSTGSNAISYPLYQDFRDKNQVLSGMFCKFGGTSAHPQPRWRAISQRGEPRASTPRRCSAGSSCPQEHILIEQ